ncbi:MAG: thiamine phosphate synthase [Candidatus Omnitrophica bacterium]|nr:thiamine phosphate synthase [Candidatus Omnitrophota bacterium]MCM8806937.1 thiamine phosphate synthase [Candidatus Omnitrophota bacterium]
MQKILKIIDTNFNRAREGLRVIEESIRFIYKNEKNLKEIREIRHIFSKKTLKFFPFEKLKSSRAVEEDIGKKLDKREKLNLVKLVETNFLRVEESLRCLEEYSKLINSNISSFFHDIRFKVYEIEKKIITLISRKRIKVPSVYVILNLKEENKNFFKFAENIIKGEPDIIQLRYKGENTKFFLKTAKNLKKIIPDEIIYIINDRIDISILCESDGIHVGKDDIDIDDARRLIPEKIIGVSSNNLNDIRKIKNKDIDYIAVGSIFKSPTKPEKKVVGIEILEKIKKIVSIPVIGIGGINIENAKMVIEKGADGIAVISTVENSENPKETITKLKEEVYKGWKIRKRKTI